MALVLNTHEGCDAIKQKKTNQTKPKEIYIYSSEHEDQNDVKKKCEITFYFKAS